MMVDVRAWLKAERSTVDQALDRLLPAESEWPEQLHRAMRYAVFGGGKRIRPILARTACEVAGSDSALVLEASCALELIHTYSLVHDDLPALDNDDLRRGRPTVHVAFDEPMAILVGDALLTEAFSVLARFPEGEHCAARRADGCRVVAAAVGSAGMVGGQVEDLEATGGPPDALRLDRVHRAKTGALLAASVELGAVVAGAGPEERERFRGFGQDLGLLFQIADDILDVMGTAESLGKTAGKDEAAGKLTYPSVYGLEAARRKRDDLAGKVIHLAEGLEGAGGRFSALVAFIASRDH
jgi:geranylgeranyl diphosphate synthase, type II